MQRISTKKKKKALKIIIELRNKMKELKKIDNEIKKQEKKVSPQKAIQLIQEIKVPSLEIIKEEKRQNEHNATFKQDKKH